MEAVLGVVSVEEAVGTLEVAVVISEVVPEETLEAVVVVAISVAAEAETSNLRDILKNKATAAVALFFILPIVASGSFGHRACVTVPQPSSGS